PGAMDLDQAMLLWRRPRGRYCVHYAIADLPAFVRAGGPLDRETMRRGQTLYLPDAPVPLHPPVLSAGAASLLPDQVRPAALWTIELDADGEPSDARVRRALVRSVARLDYAGVQADVADGRLHPSIEVLPELGRLRRALAVARGAVELELPEQEIEADGARWRIVLRKRTEVDAWNAEISLLTGMCAAQLMLQARIGLLRTLPAPDDAAIAELRRHARSLGVQWADGETPAGALSALDPRDPAALAVLTEATRLLRGAGYVGFDGAAPRYTWHTGIGAPYAHVTAPLRRLVDRYGAEVCLAVCAGTAVPEWTRNALRLLPEVMASSDRRAAQVERACLDQVESWLLGPRVGEEFEAIVLRSNGRDARNGPDDLTGRDDRNWRGAEVFIADPPTLARCTGDHLVEGTRVTVRLAEADPVARKVHFATKPPPLPSSKE
ncbi:MAG TPA: RNB domain-containing ribonuclease, partial [Pseudonocardiaceae bacterium]